MAWRELSLTVEAKALASCEALLELVGACATSVHDAGDAPLFEPEPGRTPVWPNVEVRALFPADVDLDAVSAVLSETLGEATAMHISDVGEDWRRAWRQRVESRRFGKRIELVPAEEDAAANAAALRLHMGLAFGTGEHPTTALCLEWLDEQVGTGMEILDYGCGSGVLALAARKLGARFAYAVDADAQALEATRENARLNALEGIWIGAPESLPGVEVDLVIANILAGPLKRLAATFAAHTKPGGRIALSGMLASQVEEIERAYARDFEAFEHTVRDGWACISARRALPAR